MLRITHYQLIKHNANTNTLARLKSHLQSLENVHLHTWSRELVLLWTASKSTDHE